MSNRYTDGGKSIKGEMRLYPDAAALKQWAKSLSAMSFLTIDTRDVMKAYRKLQNFYCRLDGAGEWLRYRDRYIFVRRQWRRHLDSKELLSLLHYI